jgi:predicted PolB exonuclease-like 3'-5' exonuclease
MHQWWMGAKKHVSLDEMLWALGLESSKTATADGSRVFEMYHSGRLEDIREYNLRDIRATRRAFELMAAAGMGSQVCETPAATGITDPATPDQPTATAAP